ncbi:hypothetical protein [Nocardioides sp. zg-1230]|uniref:hypothetical protein n=1 Tax=Nocardioides sp. zg-1230 TaxID=2736601 RepID=UPI00155661EF|nr:hypothetical protein [Nocardioides sp. zg-1230]NPC45074.1 hypothetical protein [Nocardioides sp. zg-1230]
MSALLMLLVGISILFVFGLPLAQRAYPGRAAAAAVPEALVVAPLLGYGVLTFLTRVTASLGLATQLVAWPLLVAGLLALVPHLRRRRGGPFREAVRATAPVWVAFAAVTVTAGLSFILVGPRFYRGYAYWDTYFYASQAEALRVSAPGQVFAEFGNHPFAEAATAVDFGPERLARALMQSFLASVLRTDGGSTVGFIGVVSVGWVFLAFLLLTKDWSVGPKMRIGACASAALLPAVVVGQVQGFIPMAMVTGLVIAFIRVLDDTLRAPSAARALALAFLISGAAFTLMEALYVMAPLTLVALVTSQVLDGRVSGLVHAVGAWLAAVVLSVPLGNRLLSEILSSTESMTRTGLNEAYPFAYSPRVLTWTFWANSLEGRTDLVAAAATAVAVGIYILGLHGLLRLAMDPPSTLGIVLAAYTLMPLAFVVTGEDLRYSFYKMFALTVPLVWVGAWLTASRLRQALRGAQPGNRVKHQLRRLIGLAAVAVMVVAGFAGAACSVVRVYSVAGSHPEVETANTRIGIWRYVDVPEKRASFDAYEALAGRPVVAAFPDQTTLPDFWWSVYYLRNSPLWVLGRTTDDLFAGPGDTARDISTAPLDAEVVYPVDYDNLGAGADGSFGLVVEGTNLDVVTPFRTNESEGPVTSIRINTFSRTGGTLALTVRSQAPEAVRARGVAGLSALRPGDTVVRIPVPRGGHVVDIDLEGAPEGTFVSFPDAEFIPST